MDLEDGIPEAAAAVANVAAAADVANAVAAAAAVAANNIHNGLDMNPNAVQVPRTLPMLQPQSLEDLCVDAFLTRLETDAVALIGVAQSGSSILRSVAKNASLAMRDNMKRQMSGLASASVREKMLAKVLSQEYPTSRHCKREPRARKDGDYNDDHLENLLADFDYGHPPGVHSLFSKCVNTCCTGAHVQEVMASLLANCDVRQLVFSGDRMNPRRLVTPYAGLIDFDAPLVLSFLLEDSHKNRHSQLERIIFSENFLKEENGSDLRADPTGVASTGGSEAQLRHRKHVQDLISRNRETFTDTFAPGGGIYRGSDRTGLALGSLLMFRDLKPDNWWEKLTEVVLKNNIQCDLYSKASFQFEFLSAIGLGCPRLRILDIFGTDTWADCLVAFFFRDAFHSLHRYLFFMENEEDEASAYHPHDVTRYCQFCIDMLHPNVLERNWTVNPVIPLLDEIYDHVLRRYPKRSYCILRNCIRLSDLVSAPRSNVFELERTADMRRLGMPVPQSWREFARQRKDRGGDGDDDGDDPRPTSSHRQGDVAMAPSPSTTGSRKSARLQRKGGGKGKCRCKEPIQQERKRRGVPLPVKNTATARPEQEGEEEETSKADPTDSPSQLTMMTRSLGKRSLEGPHAATKESSSSVQASGQPIKKRLRSSVAEKANECDEGPSPPPPAPTAPQQPQPKSPSRSKAKQLRRSQRQRNPSGHAAAAAAASANAAGRNELDDGEDEEEDEAVRGAMRVGTRHMSHKEWDETNVDCYCPNREIECFKTGGCGKKIGRCQGMEDWEYDTHWIEPAAIKYRQITDWPHLNKCISTLEVLNIGGSNVLGEFIPFMLLFAPKLKSLGQWFNTMIYGVELLRQLPGHENDVFPAFEEFSYSTDRNYFCQPYIGFVPETQDFKTVRKEMVRMSHKVAKRLTNSNRNHATKRRQIADDCRLIRSACPNLRKLNVVLHHKAAVMDEDDLGPWRDMAALQHLVELDLVTMKFANVKALLTAVGPRLETLTLEMDEDQGNGSEIVHIGRHCTKLKSLRLLIGDKVLRGETTLHYGCNYFSALEHLTVEGSVHLHAFAFLWGNARNLQTMRLGLVVSTEIIITNVLIYDVFQLLYQVNPMASLRELHIKSLKVRSLAMANFLLDSFPSLEKTSSWTLNMNVEDTKAFRARVKEYRERGVKIEYKEW